MKKGPPQTRTSLGMPSDALSARNALGLSAAPEPSVDPLLAFMEQPAAHVPTVPQRPNAAVAAPPPVAPRPRPAAAAAAAAAHPPPPRRAAAAAPAPVEDPLGLGYVASAAARPARPLPVFPAPRALPATPGSHPPVSSASSRPAPPPRPPRVAPGASDSASGTSRLAAQFFAGVAAPPVPLDPSTVPRSGAGLRAWAVAGAWTRVANLARELTVAAGSKRSAKRDAGNPDGRSPLMQRTLLHAVALARLGDTAALQTLYVGLREPLIASTEHSGGAERAAADAALAAGTDAQPFALLVLHAQAVAGANPRQAFERVERLLVLLRERSADAAGMQRATVDRRPHLEPLELPFHELDR